MFFLAGGALTGQLAPGQDAADFLLPSLRRACALCRPEIEAEAEPHAGANSDEEQERDDGVAGADEDRRAPPRALRGSSLGPQWMSSLMGAPHRPQAPRERAGFGFFVGAGAGSSGEGAGGARGADGCLSPLFVERDCRGRGGRGRAGGLAGSSAAEQRAALRVRPRRVSHRRGA